ncbi:hypothetical protein COU17_02195 [Candidatus Kaiserbacteria bacterium CG10_big_fil_rev_8_21_14_0_10_49_17]|uniref:DNA polymerase III subunit delta n=1 Tax=Candidatus Kaiserbacteria bacterium CG10_big_fil_rev_8_21_14_0_10_49_17 TaxID=1974609 RepID=A0A2M6WE56_9BACT|nr:MAG: hypothetical protein COU17_02195 [Candidatus Kaiserbacteria bacterium CG10_big_fil_rev_8_21_14_0_10_49_17]
MDILKSALASDALHHAYLLSPASREDVFAFIETGLGMPMRGNPDVHIFERDTFTIDDARVLKERENRAPLSGTKKVFIVSFSFIQTEAQNALLKVLEEPSESTHFFFFTPSPEQLLGTVRSRVMDVSVSGGVSKMFADVPAFLAMSPAKRIEFLASLIEEKDRIGAIQFLNELETELAERKEKIDTHDLSIFSHIRRARSYLSDRAPSVKILLEHIALTTPRI